jgi:uncharacterized membrane protein YphA (DoxX/SURF4 family)
MVSTFSKMTSSPGVFLILRIVLGAVFIWASVSKIASPQGFAEILSNYQVLPPVLVIPVAVILPWVEALCGVSLIAGRLIRGSALIFVSLMLIFLMVTAFNMYRGLDVNCGCFSVADSETSGSQLVNLLRNLLLLIAGVFVFRQAGTGDR